MASKTLSPQRSDRHPFLLPIGNVAQQLGTNIETGLSARQVTQLRNDFPPNELVGGGGVSWYKILVKQISNAMILVSVNSQLILIRKLTVR
jgi:P-type Na+/K+ transporter